MNTQNRLFFLTIHMFLAGLQTMSVIWNVAKGDAVMVAFSAVMAAFSGFCAYELYGKIMATVAVDGKEVA